MSAYCPKWATEVISKQTRRYDKTIFPSKFCMEFVKVLLWDLRFNLSKVVERVFLASPH